MQVVGAKEIIAESASATEVVLKNEYLPAETLYLQVSGAATAFTLEVYGASVPDASDNDNWVVLAAIDMTTFATSQSVVANGIFAFGVDSCRSVKVALSSVSGGNVSVYARTVVGG